MSYQFVRYVCAFLIMLAGSFFCVAKINADSSDTISISISPITYKLVVEKGQKDRQIIRITNPNDFKIRVVSEAEDFLMEDEIGTPKFLPEGSGKSTLSKWISVKENDLILNPKETREIEFVVSVPADGEPGGHYAALFYKTVPSGDGSNQISISSRVGSLILVTVPGDISKTGQIVDFKSPKFLNSGPVKFSARFKNSGSVHYQTDGEIEIYNWFGNKVGSAKLGDHIILPDSVRLFEGEWNKKFMIGKYRATLKMPDGEANILETTLSFFVFPWKIFLIFVALLGVALIIMARFKKTYKLIKK